jgi:two-component system, OmpR family, sensor histidine kinase BaeS
VSGSGIGLSVAAELARAHGGDLAASSEPGHGTTMTLTLPTA